MKQEIVVRINLFIIVFLLFSTLIPALILLKEAYDAYIYYKSSLVEEHDNFYLICSLTNCYSFEKESIYKLSLKYGNLKFPISNTNNAEEILKSINFVLANCHLKFIDYPECLLINRLKTAIESAIFFKEIAKEDFYFYTPLSLIALLLPLYILFIFYYNKITLVDNTINFKLFLNFRIIKRSFSIDSIERINIITTTPHFPKRKNIEDINWKEIVQITVQMEEVTIPLIIFPGFKKILKKIIEKNPQIKLFIF